MKGEKTNIIYILESCNYMKILYRKKVNKCFALLSISVWIRHCLLHLGGVHDVWHNAIATWKGSAE